MSAAVGEKQPIRMSALRAVPVRRVCARFDSADTTDNNSRRKRGLVVAISDFLYPAGFSDGLRLLRWAGHEVFCLQTLAADDLSMELHGDTRLVCAETAQSLMPPFRPASGGSMKTRSGIGTNRSHGSVPGRKSPIAAQ